MLNSRRIAELEESITKLTAERDALASQVSSLAAERDQAREQLGTAQASVTKLESANLACTGQVSTLLVERDAALNSLSNAEARITEVEAGRDAEIVRQVTERCAAAGVAPIQRDPAAGDTRDPDQKPTQARGLEAARERLNARHRALHGKN